ncbi:hypothetical protein [Ancylobacter vacuolatus]|uniref:Cytochrome bd-type quinol oxidase subunit 2 n=1 Tax=Ancylobacter vacuolatus TaxID=223389 RepID=A0ABU0DKS1_9HYPH|nr:hypothetical protein [Ancylobacter vacuolatus]MDQ0349037.1 cytochrome bd-type quinol oxidase subunit 2 [Ancylobacter vacuolatus]
MSLSFLQYLSDTQLLVLIPALSCLALLLATAVLRSMNVRWSWFDYDSDIVDTATQNTMSGAYVVLGFVLALVMTTASSLDDKVSQEAQVIKSLNRLLILEGTEPALDARKALLAYTQSIITDEWPVLKEGHGSETTSKALADVFWQIDRIDPQSAKSVAEFSKILDTVELAAQMRNDRILSVNSALPSMFYTVSLLSIFGVIIICGLRLVEATPVRAITLTVQLIMLTLLLAAIAIIDLPYLGDTTTSAESLQDVYNGLKLQDPTLRPGAS